ncbi:MAG: pyridoxal 5'-phosphate synthase glutaminase subunit PdxT [Bacteroidaceae bacterium]|nr:pyridoxal 5'-phosphate synthase glutaminase subunit PdxT [Bacteroidaceae bacterium]
MKIAILALQGAFAEHQQMLHKLGVETFLVRNLADWQQQKDGLIIPGGESTAMTRIMHDQRMWQPLQDAIREGLPVFGTCAGMIMLDRNHLATMDMEVKRNAYGRQLGSFYTESAFADMVDVKMPFIRAPYIEEVGEGVEVLSVLDGHIIAARQGRQLVTSFHPELTDDTRVHEYFLNMKSGH